MLLQTNSYIVPRDKRMEHARLLRRFRQTLLRLGCDHFEVYEQVGANWNTGETTGRFVQIMRFRDRKHQLEVQGAERVDPAAQNVVKEFCELINFPYQQQQGLFAVGFYTSFLRMPPQRTTSATSVDSEDQTHGGNGAEHTEESHAEDSHEHEIEEPRPMMISPEPGVVQRGQGDRETEFVDPEAENSEDADGAPVNFNPHVTEESNGESAETNGESTTTNGESAETTGEHADESDLVDLSDEPMTPEEIERVRASLAADGGIEGDKSLDPLELEAMNLDAEGSDSLPHDSVQP